MPDDASRPDFTSRVAQHRALADAYRTRAQMARDDVLRKIFAGLAATYENMARVVEQTALRIESIKLTTARAREKIVAAVAKKFVCIVDASKRVDVLGKFPLPVEVIPMARSYIGREMVKLGGQPVLRDGFTTDNGNLIIDVHGLVILDPVAMETTIRALVGVVSVGLFAQRGADVILLGTDSGVKTIAVR